MFLFTACAITAVKVYSFKCPACGYQSRHQVGTPDGDQILTDVNTEFAQYRLFVCRKEKKFVHADVLDVGFDNKCPSDAAELEEVEPRNARCPRCGRELMTEEVKPLAAADSSAE
jgi:hypothetical protein